MFTPTVIGILFVIFYMQGSEKSEKENPEYKEWQRKTYELERDRGIDNPYLLSE